MVGTIINLWLYLLPLIIVIWLISLGRKSLKPNQVSLLTSVKLFYEQQKGQLKTIYEKSEMADNFKSAGLKLTPLQYRLYRDTTFIVLLVFLHIKYLLTSMSMQYPVGTLVFLVILYVAAQLRPIFPIYFVLKIFKKQYDAKKNTEVFMLQQLLSNEYADVNTTRQNLYHLFLYLRKFTNTIQPAIDKFLEEYPLDPYNKEKAFKSFSAVIGTPESESLSQILFQIDQSSPEDVRDLLQKKYEELKTKRQQSYKALMQDRGTMGYVLTFTGVLIVILCGLFVYFLEYKDMMAVVYNVQ